MTVTCSRVRQRLWTIGEVRTHTPSAERARVPSHPYSRTGREKANSAALQIAYSSRSSQIQLAFNLQQHSLIVRRQVVLLYIDTGECTKGVGLG